jgi:hypothetical protein
LEEVNVKKKLSIVLAVVLTLTLLLTSGAFAAGGKKEVIPVQMVLDASLSEVSTSFDTPKENLEVATSRAFTFKADSFLLSSIVDKQSNQAYMVSTDAQGKVWIAEPKIEGALIDYMSQMKPDETVTVNIWAIYVSPEEELWQIPSKYPDVPFEGYLPALGADVSPEVLDLIDADIEEIKLRAHEEAVQPIVDFLQSTGSTILYVSKYAPIVIVELSKEDVYKLARLPEAESISLPNEPEPCMDTAAHTINADDVWDEGYDGGMSDGSGHQQTKVAVIDTGIDFTHDALTHAYGDTIPGGVVDSDHGTAVAGCVASIPDPEDPPPDNNIRGIAYGTKLLDADYTDNTWGEWDDTTKGNLVSACDWAHENDADIYNFSSGFASCGNPDHFSCKYFDHIAFAWYRLPVCAVGNDGRIEDWEPWVRSPANAWNVLAVGGIADKNTEDWSDDTIADFSNWVNPNSLGVDDRQKPEVCAPAVDIKTTKRTGGFEEVVGTSYAAPQVSGIAAMLMEKNYFYLRYYPILIKAIIMASAIHNVVPNNLGEDAGYPMDNKEGVGTVDAYAAYDCLSSDRTGLWATWNLEDELPLSFEFDAVAGEMVRFVITWYAHTDYYGSIYYGNGLCADLGLEIQGTGSWQGQSFGESNSYDSAWEIVQFQAPYTGTYIAEISADYHGGDAWTYNWGEYIAAACYRSSDGAQVAAGGYHTVGLKSDGTLVAAGYNYYGQCNVGGWTDITQVAAGGYHTVGLKGDGTVVATGDNFFGQCNVGGWTDITQVAASGLTTVGLKSDGTVVATGDNFFGQCNVGSWSYITQVAAGDYHTVGLKSNGTVVAKGWNYDGQCGVSGWTDITQVAAGPYHTVGLKSNGTVVAVGPNTNGQCDVGGWTDITQVAAGYCHTVGLKSNGTVVAKGWNYYGQCGVSGWTDITQVAAGYWHTVGVKSDSTAIAVGYNYYGQCDVEDW